MKAKICVFSVLALGLFLSGCKNSPKTDEELENELSIEDIVDADLSGEQRSQEQLMRDTVRVDGILYTYEIHRVSSDELPQVRGDYSHNAIFFDNTASLRVKRGETVIYSNTFTKNSFSNFIEPEMLKNSILEGLVFDHIIEGGIQFAAAVRATDEVVKATKHFMESVGAIYCHKLPLPAQEEIGKYWKH